MVEAICRRSSSIDVPDIYSVAVRDGSVGISNREVSAVRVGNGTSGVVITGIREGTVKVFRARSGSRSGIEGVIVRTIGGIRKRAVLGKVGNDVVRTEI